MEGINGRLGGLKRIGGQSYGCLGGVSSVEGEIKRRKPYMYCIGTQGSNSAHYLQMPGFTLSSSTPWSLSMWIYVTSTTVGSDNYGVLFGSNSGLPQGLYLKKTGSILNFDMYFSGDHLSIGIVPINQWTHYVGVNNGITYTHYINGVASGSTSAAPISASQCFSDTTAEQWQGYMCEFYAFNQYALTLSEIGLLLRSKKVGIGMQINAAALQLTGFYFPMSDVYPGQQIMKNQNNSPTIIPYTLSGDGTGRTATDSSGTSILYGYNTISIDKALPWENGLV